jgi:hypothetical protein
MIFEDFKPSKMSLTGFSFLISLKRISVVELKEAVIKGKMMMVLLVGRRVRGSP